MDKGWKERIVTRRNEELIKRGIKIPKDEEERKKMLSEANERGGIFVAATPKEESIA